MNTIMSNKDLIALLKSIEKECEITVLHSALIGSHTTGLAVNNSDLDVFMIYADRADKYFDIKDPKLTVEVKTGNARINAFSLKRAIGMITDSSPTIHQILSSPCPIYGMPDVYDELVSYSKQFFNPNKVHSSLSKAVARRREIIYESSTVQLKVFLTYVRLTLSLFYCNEYGAINPNFYEILNASQLEEHVKKAILDIVDKYLSGCEEMALPKIRPLLRELNTYLRDAELSYPLRPFRPVDDIVRFHMETVLRLDGSVNIDN